MISNKKAQRLMITSKCIKQSKTTNSLMDRYLLNKTMYINNKLNSSIPMETNNLISSPVNLDKLANLINSYRELTLFLNKFQTMLNSFKDKDRLSLCINSTRVLSISIPRCRVNRTKLGLRTKEIRDIN